MADPIAGSDQSGSAVQRQAPARRETYLDEIVDCVWKQPDNYKPGDLTGHDLLKGGIKTASLFLGKRLGIGASAISYALDQASTKDSVGENVVDLTLGATKGAGLALTFNWIGAKDFNIAAKGVTLGTTSRLIDTGLTRQSYLNQETGSYDAMLGLSRTIHQSVNLRAAAGDIAVFGTSHFLLKGMDGVGLAHLRQSRLAGTMLTGSTFGVSSGTYHEIMRQGEAGEGFDFAKVVKHGLAHGLVDGLASGPGGFRAALAKAPELQFHEATKAYRERLGTPEKTNYNIETPVPGARKFVNWADFMSRGVSSVPTPSRIYNVSGHEGRLVVPENFAARLDRVRNLRDFAAQDISSVSGLGAKVSVFSARLKLDLNANRTNALPEEVVAAMDKAPDRRFFKDIRLESKSPYEQYYREKYKRSEDVEGELYQNGNISLFGTKSGRDAELFLQHEWTHIAEKFNPATREAFETAAKMEGVRDDGAYMFRDYADVKSAENWAVHYGEVLLGGTPKQFEAMAFNAPLRTSVLTRSLKEIISQVPEAQRSTIEPLLVERINFVEQRVIPQAQKYLNSLTHPDAVAMRLFLAAEK
ncbi:MAG: hypothetical protein K2Y39_28155 [Candidatus Obscuribacterales bacterium]|nr:hypothetical protein [Candidatus Obscuribacterales bacterium]